MISGSLAAVIAYTISLGWVAVLLVGLPQGIWLGMACAMVYMWAICVIGTSVAGTLVRRHGRLRSAIVPYAELGIPSILTVVYANGLLFQFLIGIASSWKYLLPLTVLLATASIGVLRRWHWLVRTVLHIAWLVAFCAYVLIGKANQIR